MQYHTKEMTVTLRPDNILAVKINEGCNELTTEGTEECLQAMTKALALNDHPKAMIFWMAPFYVKKEVIKSYSTSEFDEVAVALVCHSYISKFVASVALKMRERFTSSEHTNQNAPIKVFLKEEEAFEWLQECLAKRQAI
ncbi:hypothetical protein [Aureispira anguillae]|uniref:Uncharacterized protein n=1 Tax=Aureispira anguillae TaxID=2864201 RepID=A0A915YEV2_9BACT|nr:hypothetical protein [Aureispira anguillae]BDS11752.1 hypothetical protein AsAng_0024660 [Aureispira anguillae]